MYALREMTTHKFFSIKDFAYRTSSHICTILNALSIAERIQILADQSHFYLHIVYKSFVFHFYQKLIGEELVHCPGCNIIESVMSIRAWKNIHSPFVSVSVSDPNPKL